MDFLHSVWDFVTANGKTILFVCGGMASTAVFIQTLFTIQKLRKEINKYNLEMEKVKIEIAKLKVELEEKEQMIHLATDEDIYKLFKYRQGGGYDNSNYKYILELIYLVISIVSTIIISFTLWKYFLLFDKQTILEISISVIFLIVIYFILKIKKNSFEGKLKVAKQKLQFEEFFVKDVYKDMILHLEKHFGEYLNKSSNFIICLPIKHPNS